MVTIDDLTPVEKTLLITLTGRALDARAKRPLLGDRLAADALDRLRLGSQPVNVGGTVQIATAIRSRMLDRIVSSFTGAHPDAVVVELGCGLETRMHRLKPPATVDWYDVDLPDVIALRQKVLPEPERAHLVAASLTDPSWLNDIPRDRPVIAVADGVLGFLTEADNRRLVRMLVDHFVAGGELAVVAYSRLTARLMGSLGVLRSVGIPKGFRGFGFNDPEELERFDPRLRFVEEQLGAEAPESAQLGWGTRVLARLFTRWRAQGRRGVWVLRYRFGPQR